MNHRLAISPCRRFSTAVRRPQHSEALPGNAPARRRLQTAGTAVALTALALLLVSAPDSSACAACFGASDSKLAEGMNAGIFALMGVIGSVLFAIAAFFVFIVRRAVTHPLPIPGETISTLGNSNA